MFRIGLTAGAIVLILIGAKELWQYFGGRDTLQKLGRVSSGSIFPYLDKKGGELRDYVEKTGESLGFSAEWFPKKDVVYRIIKLALLEEVFKNVSFFYDCDFTRRLDNTFRWLIISEECQVQGIVPPVANHLTKTGFMYGVFYHTLNNLLVACKL